jgi:hypothetical protein
MIRHSWLLVRRESDGYALGGQQAPVATDVRRQEKSALEVGLKATTNVIGQFPSS